MKQAGDIAYKIVESNSVGTYTMKYKVSDGSTTFNAEVCAEPHRPAVVSIDGVDKDSDLHGAIETVVLADYWDVADALPSKNVAG